MKFIFNKNGDIYYSENNEQLKQYSVNANNLIVAFNDINIRDYTPYIVFERADGKTTPLIGMAFTTIEYGGLPYQAVQYGFNDLWVTAVSGELKFNVVLKKNNTVIYNGGITLWVTESIKENELIYIDDVAYTQLNNRIASLEKDMVDIKDGSLVVKESEKAINDSLGNPIHTTYAKNVNIPTKTSQLTNDSKFVTEDNIPTKISQLENDSDYVNEEDLKSALGNIVSFKVEIVDILPTQDISSSTIYLVKNESDEENNSYYEYLYINNRWELIGTTQVNFNALDKVDKIIPTGDGGKFEYIYSKGSDEFYFAKRDADGNFISLLKFYKNGIQMRYKNIDFILSDMNGTGFSNYIEQDGIKRLAELSVSAFGPRLSFATMDTNKGETQWQEAGGIYINSNGVKIGQLTDLDERSQNYIKNIINPLLTNKVNRYELPTNTGDLINTSGFVSNFKKFDNPIALNEGVWKFNESNTAAPLVEKNISFTINFKDSLGNEFIRMGIGKTNDRTGWYITGVRADNTNETIYKHIIPEYEWDYEKSGLAVITNKSILRNDYYLIFEEDNTNNVGDTGKTLLQNFIDWGIVSKYKKVEFATQKYVGDNTPTKISQLENDKGYLMPIDKNPTSLLKGEWVFKDNIDVSKSDEFYFREKIDFYDNLGDEYIGISLRIYKSIIDGSMVLQVEGETGPSSSTVIYHNGVPGNRQYYLVFKNNGSAELINHLSRFMDKYISGFAPKEEVEELKLKDDRIYLEFPDLTANDYMNTLIDRIREVNGGNADGHFYIKLSSFTFTNIYINFYSHMGNQYYIRGVEFGEELKVCEKYATYDNLTNVKIGAFASESFINIKSKVDNLSTRVETLENTGGSSLANQVFAVDEEGNQYEVYGIDKDGNKYLVTYTEVE